MSLDDVRGFLQRILIHHVHRQRRGRHDERHHALPDRGPRDRGDEQPAPRNRAKRPCFCGTVAARRMRSWPQCEKSGGRDKVASGDCRERPAELHVLHPRFAPRDQAGPEDSPQHRPDQNHRHRLGRGCRAHALHRGKPVLLGKRRSASNHHRGGAEQRKTPVRDGCDREDRAHRSRRRAQRKPAGATDASHGPRGKDRAQRRAHDQQRNRQSGQRRIVRQPAPQNPPYRDHGHRPRNSGDLRHNQDRQITVYKLGTNHQPTIP